MQGLQKLVAELAAAGVPPQDIPGIIQSLGQETERRRQAGTRAGFSQGYLNSITGPQLFGQDFDNTISLLTGQTETDREQSLLGDAANAQQARVGTGLSLLDFAAARDREMRQLEADPFNIVSYLSGIASLPAGSGNPAQALIGSGFQIKPQLPSYLNDPRMQQTYGSLLEFGRPRTPAETVTETRTNQVASAYAQDPEAAARFFQQDPAALARMFGPKAYGRGGTEMLDEPTVGIGMFSGQPRFLAGEAGPERLDFTPVKDASGPPATGIREFAHGGSLFSGFTRNYTGTGATREDAYKRSGLARDYGDSGRLEFARRVAGRRERVVNGQSVFQNVDEDDASFDERMDRVDRNLAATRNRRAAVKEFGQGYFVGKSARARRAGRPATQPTADRGGALPRPVATDPVATAPAEGPPASGTVTPAQAAAMSLGRGLANNPFAPPELVRELLAGRPAPPGALTQRLRANIDPILWQALLGVNQGFGYRPDSVLASALQFDIGSLPRGSVRYA